MKHRSFRLRFGLLCIPFLLLCTAEAQLITKRVTIQPIQVVSGSTVGNPNLTLFEAATDQIWAQAGIDVSFNSWITWNGTANGTSSSQFINTSAAIENSNSLNALANLTGMPWSNEPTTVLRMWFVNTIDNNSSVLGYTLQNTVGEYGGTIIQNGGGIAIANSTFSQGYVDTLAHEIGHALGLFHDNDTRPNQDVFSQNGRNLMLANPVGFPTSTSNVFPNGNDLGQLTAGQISDARMFPFAVDLPLAQQYTYSAIPEPAHFAGVAGGLFLVFACVQRKRRAAKSGR